jgi:endogenous inhibitor of DNA gyrase (YacG/DUF329 family)
MPARDRLRASQLAMRVSCPNCRTDMTLRTVIPVMSREGFLEITYACPTCQGETKRQVKDDG